MTLFEKYGGVPTVSVIVRAFYKRILENRHLSPYFKETDVETLIEHQIQFIAYLLGRPVTPPTGDFLKKAHEGRRISETAFDEVLHILEHVLEAHNMEQAEVSAVLSRIASFKNDIVELPNFPRIH